MILTSQFFIITVTAAIAAVAFGAFWYSPRILGESWRNLTGITCNTADKGDCHIKMFVTLLCNYATAVALYTFIAATGATSAQAGMSMGFWIGLGIVLPGMLGQFVWEKKPGKLFMINGGGRLLTLVLMGSIIGHLMGILMTTAETVAQ